MAAIFRRHLVGKNAEKFLFLRYCLYALLVSQWSCGHFLKQNWFSLYPNSMINLCPLTPHIMPCFIPTIVSWPSILWLTSPLCITVSVHVRLFNRLNGGIVTALAQSSQQAWQVAHISGICCWSLDKPFNMILITYGTKGWYTHFHLNLHWAFSLVSLDLVI